MGTNNGKEIELYQIHHLRIQITYIIRKEQQNHRRKINWIQNTEIIKLVLKIILVQIIRYQMRIILPLTAVGLVTAIRTVQNLVTHVMLMDTNVILFTVETPRGTGYYNEKNMVSTEYVPLNKIMYCEGIRISFL